MKTEDLRIYFRKIKEGTNGTDVSNPGETIDFENGNSITINEIKNEYSKYLELCQEVDDYIEDYESRDLYTTIKYDDLVKHFENIIDEDYFKYNESCLKDFVDYMVTKINKKNECVRKVNLMFAKNGNGYTTTRITIPVPWAKELGFTEQDRTGILLLEEGKVILKKEI